jgi:hypothetical protein
MPIHDSTEAAMERGMVRAKELQAAVRDKMAKLKALRLARDAEIAQQHSPEDKKKKRINRK